MEWPTDPRRGILAHRFAQLRCETSELLRQVESFKALIEALGQGGRRQREGERNARKGGMRASFLELSPL